MQASPAQESRPVTIDEQVLREAMIAELQKLDAVRTEAVAEAFRAVSRPAFLPEATPARAYEAEDAVVTKRDADGTAISSVSAARIQAFMLEQARIEPGMRVLEIGSGGLNAALIAELVGPGGAVTTVDIDPEVTGRALRLLSEAGYPQVDVVTGDGVAGAAAGAPFDRIIVTVEASDLASAWVDQLAVGGRIVVPLRLRSLTRSVAFVRAADGSLVSDGYELCGFVPMRGAGANRLRRVMLHDTGDEQVSVRADDGQALDPGLLGAAWAWPRIEGAWSGVTIGGMQPFDDLELWLATTLPEFGLLAATREARTRGVVRPGSGTATALDSATGSFAYLTTRAVDAERAVFEFGAAAHGPRADETAAPMIEQMRVWDREQRGARPRFIAQPATQPAAQPAELAAAGLGSVARTVERPCYRFKLVWPAATGAGHA